MEACGPSGWINDLCLELGLKTLVCSTNDEAWRWKNVKRKTDKDDALKLARMASCVAPWQGHLHRVVGVGHNGIQRSRLPWKPSEGYYVPANDNLLVVASEATLLA